MSTLLQLRQKIGNRLNFRLNGTVTTVATGEPKDAFIDAGNQEPENSLADNWVLFTSGNNAGLSRQIAGNMDGSITFRRGFPAAIAVSDAYDLYRRFTPGAITDAVNYAIRNVLPYLYVHFEQEVNEDPTTVEYAYPAGLIELRQLRRRTNPITTGTNLVATGALTTALVAGTAYTSLATSAISGAIGQGVPVIINYSQGDQQQATTSAPANAGAVSIPVTSFVATQNFAVGTALQAVTSNVTPPFYQDLRGEYWEDLGQRVRVRYAPRSGQTLMFIGYAAFPELSADTDSTVLPDELVIAGAAQNLYENLLVGEAGSSSGFFEKQADKWNKYYEQLKLRYAMPAIPWELHPPGHRVVRGWATSLGPVIGSGVS